MKFQKILENSSRAIDYFDFKTEFAKNQKYHNKNVNELVKLYNLTETLLNNKHLKLIETLLLEIYTNKLKEWKGDQKQAYKSIRFILSNLDYCQKDFLSFIEHNHYLIHYNNISIISADQFFKQKKISEDYAEFHKKEITTIFKELIKWS